MTEFGVCHQFEYANLTVDNTGVGLYLILDVEQDSYMFGENYGVSGLKVVFPLYYNTIAQVLNVALIFKFPKV